MIDIVVELLIFRPYIAICQATAGLLYPTKSPKLRRAQRATAVFLLLGICALPMAFVLGYFGVGLLTSFLVFVGDVMMLSIAGLIGGYVERKVKEAAGQDDTSSSGRSGTVPVCLG